MIIAFVIIFVALAILFGYTYWLNTQENAKLRQEFQQERQILLNRIQDPQFKVPISPDGLRSNDEMKALKREIQRRNIENAEEMQELSKVGRIIE